MCVRQRMPGRQGIGTGQQSVGDFGDGLRAPLLGFGTSRGDGAFVDFLDVSKLCLWHPWVSVSLSVGTCEYLWAFALQSGFGISAPYGDVEKTEL